MYLEDLQTIADLPLGIEVIKLVVEPKRQAKASARQLVQRVSQDANSPQMAQKLLGLIETILSREEIIDRFSAQN
ncbi:MAG: DUF2887 domain-containing protein [Alkalinema sp. RL_2_19]|nr:DUF2887 domain-containing protein [Alkalinema sp. RL_2_19]